MDLTTLEALMERISQTPSLLLLGQNYLASKTGKNPFIEELAKSFGKKDIHSHSDYSEIWKCLADGGSLSGSALSEMAEAASKVPMQPWLREILGLGWSTVYTSAIDDALTSCVGDNFGMSPIRVGIRVFRREFINKRQLHCAYLFGGLSELSADHIDIPRNHKELKRLKVPTEQKLDWIRENILPGYGVMVVDGWSPESDWLEAVSLCSRLADLHEESVYLFGFRDEMADDYEDIKTLIDDKIVITVPQTLAQILDEYGYFPSRSEYTRFDGSSTDEEGVVLSFRFKRSKSSRSILVPYDDLGALDSCITLLDDRMEIPASINNDERRQKFARFLSQRGNPTWAFFHKHVGFYCERSSDDKLRRAIREHLELDGFKRRAIMLDGPSNSGKTTTLANLAVYLKALREYPVFFISGEPGQTDFSDTLKKFIKKHFIGYHPHREESIKNAIVIWDNSSSIYAEKEYRKLERALSECNALIIGSCYARESSVATEKTGNLSLKASKNRVTVDSKLDEEESRKFERVLASMSDDDLQRFLAIMKKSGNRSDFVAWDNHNNIFYILEKLFEYEFDPDYLTIRDLLKGRLRTEANVIEQRAEQSLETFLEDFEVTQRTVLEKGLASGWQLQLQAWIDKHGGLRNPASATQLPDKSLEKKKHLELMITKINGFLAVAGQFGIELPLALLLRIIQGYDRRAKDLFSAEAKFIVDVIEDDSLVHSRCSDNGERFVRFRHAFEAERYLEIQTSDKSDTEKKEFEVDLLKGLILHANFGQGEFSNPSCRAILRLIRQFGPNSFERPSERQLFGRGLSQRGNYPRYKMFFAVIADFLLEHSNDDPEAILIAAHFLRESSAEDRSRLAKAKEILHLAIDSPNMDKSSQQYCRLLVELCSNLVTEQSDADTRRSDTIVREVRNFLDEASKKYRDTRESDETNRILDIWLNCFFNHLTVADACYPETLAYQELLAETMVKIDKWLNIFDDFEQFKLLGKIYDVYERVQNDGQITSLEEFFRKNNNDTFLYLKARQHWQLADVSISRDSSLEDWVKRDLYLIPDMPAKWVGLQLSEELKNNVCLAADASILLLEDDASRRLIQVSKSSRCLELLIRSKWISWTGSFPFEEGQMVALTTEQWLELARLCATCIDDYGSEYLPARFIRAIYTWLYSDPAQAKSLFRELRTRFGWGWQPKRVILSYLDNGEIKPRLFKIATVSYGERLTLSAKILEEVTAQSASLQGNKLVGRYGIFISDHMLDYLYGEFANRVPRTNDKPCAVHFNLNGPLLGDPNKAERG
jgi:hypothetical protein